MGIIVLVRGAFIAPKLSGCCGKLSPGELHRIALKKLQILRAAKQLDDLRTFPGLKLEKLKGLRRQEYSIRINDQFRVCLKWESGSAFDVVIEDYH